MIVIIFTLIAKVLAMISRFLIVARKSNLRTRRNTEIRVLKCP